jgi:hypothetical protein
MVRNGTPRSSPRVQDRHDVLVLQCRHRPRLAQEPPTVVIANRQGGVHRLQGDAVPQRRVFGLEDDAHAAGAEFLQHAVVAEAADLVRGPGRGQHRGRLGREGPKAGQLHDQFRHQV